MLTNIHIENYKQFEDFTMPKLGRVNLIVGKNGAGKSNLLEAIAFGKITHYEQVGNRRVINSSSITFGNFNHYMPATKAFTKEVLIKLGFEDRIPLTHEIILDLSDGVKNTVAAMNLLNKFGRSIILLDNFGEGLHYSVFQKLWEMIFELANKNDIQVFATTHSWDCIKGFTEAGKGSDAMLTRLGISARTRDKGKTIATQFEIIDCEDFITSDMEIR